MIRVLAHGCFDVIHQGHHMYLEEAKKMGDWLTVSISADEYIRKIKPAPRPYQSEVHRAYQLRNLRFVDEVFISRDDSGAMAIRMFKPHIFVRGIDYKVGGVDKREAEACKDVGCLIRFTETEKFSSTDFIKGLAA